MPDFTIVTPVLNQVQHIEKCILSVLEQDCDVQYIIIDGGSTDGTVDIIRKYESRISFWVSEPDSGQSHAINKGLKLAKGTFFNWLNADDQLTPNALKSVLEIASEETQVIIGKCEHIDENGNQVAVGGAKIWDSLEATLGNYSMGQPSVFHKTSLVKELNGMNENLHFCMDMDLWFRFLITNGQENISEIDETLSLFLVHSGSKSVESANDMRDEKYGVFRLLFKKFEIPSVLEIFFSNYPTPNIDEESYVGNLNQEVLLANFCWHLLIEAYDKVEMEKCEALYKIVMRGNRFTEGEKLIWRTRLFSKQLLGK
jgi:glycosyltransferase involved in cell wall biosynthesis